MSLFTWNDSFVLGIEELDEQNRLLVKLLANFYRDFRNNVSARDLKATLRVLLVHVEIHFEMEQLCMEESRYVDTAAHQEEHQAFVKTVLKLHAAEEAADPLHLILSLNNWINYHITHSDAAFARYLLSSDRLSQTPMQCNGSIRALVERFLSR